MDDTLYILINTIAFIILIVELYNVFVISKFSRGWTFYVCCAVSMAGAIVCDVIAYLLANAQFVIGATVANQFYFLFLSCACISWFIYSEKHQDSKIFKKKWLILLILIPVLVLEVVTICGYIFYVDTSGYHRADLYYVQPIINVSYVFFTSSKAFVLALKKENYAKRSEYLTLAAFMVIPIIFAVCQVFVGESLPILLTGSTISAVIVFQNRQRQLISRDYLTGLRNKNDFDRVLDDMISSHKEELYLIVIKIENLREINAEHGFEEGDRNLVMLSDILRKTFPRTFFLARYYGARFAVGGEAHSVEDIKYFVAKIERLLKSDYAVSQSNTKRAVSIGFALLPKTNNIPDFVAAAEGNLKLLKNE